MNASQLFKFGEIYYEENQMKTEELLLWGVSLIPWDIENGFLMDFLCSYSEPTQVPLSEKEKTSK